MGTLAVVNVIKHGLTETVSRNIYLLERENLYYIKCMTGSVGAPLLFGYDDKA